MNVRTLALALLAALLLAQPVQAYAQDDDDATEEDPEPEVATRSAWDRLLAVSVTGGWNTPFGLVGGAIEIAPIRYLNIYAGAGVGLSGARFSAGLEGRYPVGNASFGLLVGLAGGPLEYYSQGREDESQIRRYWDMTLAMHTALTMEYRWDAGIFIRLAFGADIHLAPNEASECTFSADGSDCGVAGTGLQQPVQAWIGGTVGYAFDL